MSEKTFICRVDEIEPGTPVIAKVRSLSVGVFRIGETFHALLNICPHRGAPLCEGPQCGTTAPVDEARFIYHRENEIVRCAWHGWEFDIKTGSALVDPTVRARTFPVVVEDGNVYVTA
ncbi:Rieske (2Fe-2S) protein [Mesorhizobium sp. WSM4976]|uniref:Rieske (2Fe-2S) protein n=1 Tax=Mesorhizobium sp. WSM4976 TaxID=3038549 RepID=UPI0024166FDF|nr:Rieske (2Fe-2S) protein [Mesorhizobium sp. WSM4976]MDG4897450.1 Rieske (2Fe-2S) protein [Mesorhizobium sp. WSM4976]